MRHPLTGEPVGAAGLDKALDLRLLRQHHHDGLGAPHAPQMRGVGAGSLATQRQEHRSLAFKSADDWMAYNGQFGDGDPVQAIFRHINAWRRISAHGSAGAEPGRHGAMDVRVSRSEIAKGDVGRTSMAKLAAARRSGARHGTGRLRGVADPVALCRAPLRGERRLGRRDGGRDDLEPENSALLGAAGVTAAATDPFIAQAARRLAGLPVTKDMGACSGC